MKTLIKEFSILLITSVFMIACNKDDDGEGDGVSYDCIEGNCEVSPDGTYNSESECIAQCNGLSGNFSCDDFDTFTDSRDGQVYKIIEIGNQTWFAENLNYNTGTSWCYDDLASNCDIYGRLYDWATALDACPDGWHLPTNTEWDELIDFLGGEDVAGGKMKSTGTLEDGTGYWDAPNNDATNESCFSGIGGGARNLLNFTSIGAYGRFWSATETSENGARNRVLYSHNNNIGNASNNKVSGISCRCLKD